LHIVSKRPLRKFWEKHADAQQPLEDWWKITKHANWHNLAETRRNFPHADQLALAPRSISVATNTASSPRSIIVRKSFISGSC
jgi:mRNA-degrading endonuclease HigB of HigAB toxin-antitoxin module